MKYSTNPLFLQSLVNMEEVSDIRSFRASPETDAIPTGSDVPGDVRIPFFIRSSTIAHSCPSTSIFNTSSVSLETQRNNCLLSSWLFWLCVVVVVSHVLFFFSLLFSLVVVIFLINI